jgi:DNA polymerase elongation subunit (family B)
MTTFYTSIETSGNKILFRGVENGKRVKRTIPYCPSLFVRTQKDTPYRTIHNEPLEEITFKNIWDARAFIKQYKDVGNYKIYGNTNFVYSFIADHFGDGVEYDFSKVLVGYIDIEVGSENGFPKPEDALEPVTAITIQLRDKFFVFGCGEFSIPQAQDGQPRKDIQYFNCADEAELLDAFLALWQKYTPDVISGWSIEKFDIPYLVNRLKRLYPDEIKYTKLSPWGTEIGEYAVKERIVYSINRQHQVYDLLGVACLDYFDLYKKYAPHPNQESHKLGDIAYIEIKEGKINYDEYGNLHTLYKRDFQKFMEYNIQDTALVKKINDKMRLIELAMTMAYDNRVNYQDVFSQVRMWDSIIYTHLRKQNIIIPPKTTTIKKIQFAGGYVKEPEPGLYGWGESFDLDGLYPHLIMQYNLSPETLVEEDDLPQEVLDWFTANRHNISVNGFLEGKVDTTILKKYQMTMTPNGVFFSTKVQGFLPKLMESYYEDRKKYKKEMLKYEKLLESDKENKEYRDLRTKNSNFQSAKKITLNSAYGAIGNEWFRFFDVRIAEAVTLSGQLSARWIGNKLNAYMNRLLKTQNEDYVIASDTDSVYLTMEALVKVVAADKDVLTTSDMIDKFVEAKISPYIAKCYEELAVITNAYQQKMSMKRESIFNRAIWTGKKRYFLNITNGEGGVVYDPPKIKIKGLEAIKSSTPTVCRAALKECFEIIMNKDQPTLRKFVKEFETKFMTMTLQEVSTPKSCNDLTGWANKPVFTQIEVMGSGVGLAKSCPFHVRGAIVYNNAIETMGLTKQYQTIKDGEKIKMMPLIEPNPVQSNLISFPAILPDELDLKQYLDYDTQFNKAFIKPLMSVLDAIGWSLEEESNLDALWG